MAETRTLRGQVVPAENTAIREGHHRLGRFSHPGNIVKPHPLHPPLKDRLPPVIKIMTAYKLTLIMTMVHVFIPVLSLAN